MKQLKSHFVKHEDKLLPTVWSLGGFAFFLLLFYLMLLNYSSLPKAYLYDDEITNPERFIAERAKDDLELLTDIGPKVMGSLENEFSAVQQLLSAISEIELFANPVHRIEVDHSISDGQVGSMIYRGVQNIVVKLSPAGIQTNVSLLMNSHFDTVTSSPGGGDACAQISVMLEVLRKISRRTNPLRHSIVFLLNGAEEVGLLGAHAFITQHPWAKDVKAVINLDSTGNGGREILFRAGPQNPWLMNYYRKTAAHPFTTVMAEELFRADLIPAGTDYQYFVEFGGIPGLDFAQIDNGYVYHTYRDVHETIPMESLQNTGDNILALTLALANSDELANAEGHEEGEAVFYDFLGWFLINYNRNVELAVNVVVMLLGVGAILLSGFQMSKTYGSKLTVLMELALSVGVQLLSIVCGVLLAFVLNLVYFATGRTMSWYSQPWLIFGLYFCPFMLGMCLSCIYIRKLRTSTGQSWKQTKLTLTHRIQLILHAHCLLLVLLLLVLTVMQIRSAYLLMLTILFYSIPAVINAAINSEGYKWLWAHLAGQVVTFMYFSTLTITAFICFIPVAEKYAAGANPEMVVALLSILMSWLMLGFLIPLISAFRRPTMIVGGICVIILLTWILMATPVGFPYRDDTILQRKFVAHVQSDFHDPSNGSVVRTKSGIYMEPSVTKYNPEMPTAQSVADACASELYCGIPFSHPQSYFRSGTGIWIPAAPPVFQHPIDLQLLSTQIVDGNRMRYDFSVAGPSYMDFMVSAYDTHRITSWSMGSLFGPIWKDRVVHRVSYVAGNNVFTPFEFSVFVEEKQPGSPKEYAFDVGISAHNMYHDVDHTAEFNDFLELYPKWVSVTSWTSKYELFTFE